MSDAEIVIETGDTISIEQMRAIQRELMLRVCGCGAEKRAGVSFCGMCFASLPVHLRNSLYLMLRRRFCEAVLRGVSGSGEGSGGKEEGEVNGEF